MITALCPSRGRPEQLKKSFASLGAQVETLAMVDPDEVSLYEGQHPFVAHERFGYHQLHEYYNRLASKALGDWCLLWNDDAVMLTPNWVSIVESYPPDVILNPATNLPGFCTFPIIPTRFIKTVGHFSLNAHCDTWWEFLGRELGILVAVPEIQIRHERFDLTGDNNDATYRERQYTSDDFFSGPMTQHRLVDKEKIQRLMGKL